MRKSRLYSLFEKQNGKWVRISDLAFTKKYAVQHYQSSLLAYFLGTAANERCLKVVKA